MSTFEKFIQETMTDEKIGAELRAKMEDESVTDKTNAMIELGKKYGYEFTKLDMKEYAEKMSADDGELSDDDLEMVAGGSKSGAKQFFSDFEKGLKVGSISMLTSLGFCFIED